MDNVQLTAVVDSYLKTLDKIRPHAADYNLRNPGHSVALGHAVHMCGEIKKLLGIGKTEKAHRWLGFLQGILWTQGIYTIEEMRNHNR